MVLSYTSFQTLDIPVENIPLVFRCGFVLLLVLVMVLSKDDDKNIKKYP